MTIRMNASRIRRELPATERAFDEAMLASAKLLESLVAARLESGVAASTGQAAIIRLTEAQREMANAQSNLLRVHSEMVKVAGEHMIADEGCPPMIPSKLRVAA
jgi:hypothetical protein